MEQKPYYEDEIDLTIYLDILLRWWWLPALLALVAGFAAFVVVSLPQPVYQARAGVVTLRSRAEISLGSGFETITEDDLNAATGQIIANNAIMERTRMRLNTMVGLVHSGAIAQAASEKLEGVLPDEEREPAELVEAISAEILELENSSGSSDTIQIIATHEDPEIAAAIANAWAEAYATYINRIYGESAYAPFADIQGQLAEARTEYDTAQEALLTFLTEDDRISELEREIAEEEEIVGRLRVARQTAASAVIDKAVDVKQQLITAYLQDDAENRLFAFNKGQAATREILGNWIDAEVENRMMAIQRDRSQRLQLFNAAVAAETTSLMRVFELERDEILNRIQRDWERKNRLEGLVQEAEMMRDQLVRGGEPSAASNGLALLAFKSRVFATAGGLPFDRLDIQAPSVDALNPTRTAAEQIADLDALIAAMTEEIATLETTIAAQSQDLLDGEGYKTLAQLSPDLLALSSSLTRTETLTETLGSFIAARYEDLFKVGELARGAESVAEETELFAEIQALYPKLFALDAWKELAAGIPDDTELTQQATQMSEDILELQGMEEMLAYTLLDTPMATEIANRERDIRRLRADLARLRQVKTDLEQARDLTWRAYSNLRPIAQEVNIAATSESSEVRFASTALPPRRPVSRGRMTTTALSMVVGAMLGVFGAFLFNYIGLDSSPQLLWGQLVTAGQGAAVLVLPGRGPQAAPDVADDEAEDAPPEDETTTESTD